MEDSPSIQMTEVVVDEEEGVVIARMKAPTQFVAAFRGMILDELETLAVTSVEPVDSDSYSVRSMPLEVLKRRLGSIPLRLCVPAGDRVSKHMHDYEDCECGLTTATGVMGCELCTRLFKIQVKNAMACPLHVTSTSLLPLPLKRGFPAVVAHTETAAEATRAVEAGPPLDRIIHEFDEFNGAGIPLLTLGPGEGVNLLCIATMGSSKKHAQWKAVSTVCMKQKVGVVICPQEVQAIHPVNFKRLLKNASDIVTGHILENGLREIVAVPGSEWNVENPIFTQELLKIFGRKREDLDFVEEGLVVDPQPPVSVVPLPEFELKVECTGSISPRDIIPCAIDVQKQKCVQLIDSMLEILEREKMRVLTGTKDVVCI